LNPGPADNRFRLSAHCANEPHAETSKTLSHAYLLNSNNSAGELVSSKALASSLNAASGAVVVRSDNLRRAISATASRSARQPAAHTAAAGMFYIHLHSP